MVACAHRRVRGRIVNLKSTVVPYCEPLSTKYKGNRARKYRFIRV